MAKALLPIFLLFVVQFSFAQVISTAVDFEDDTIDQLPETQWGGGTKPSTLAGDVASTMQVKALMGNVGNSTAAGKVVEVEVPTAGGFRLLDFEGLLNSGIVTVDTVRVSFDFMAAAGQPQNGFAFLRCYDDSDNSFADIGFRFNGNSFSPGILDYDPATGDYRGWLAPPFPANSFALGTWYRFEAVIDLTNNTLRLSVDGNDYGVVAGISRATGVGYAGAFFNWGSAFSGRCMIDNFQVSVPVPSNLPTAPQGFLDLLTPETHGGTVLRLPCGDFRQPGIAFRNSGSASLRYRPVYQNIATYKFEVSNEMDEADARLFSAKSFPFKANRTYEASALIRSDFPRETWEFNIGLHGADSSGEISSGGRYGGMPAVTSGPDGWERWTWRFDPHWADPYDFVNVFLGVHEFGPGFDDNVSFEIADLAFIELPVVPLQPFAPGAGVAFPGGAGTLPIKVESVSEVNDSIVVTVTSAVFIFDKLANTLTARQRIDYPRDLSQVRNLPLSGLSVSSQNNSEVILVGNDLTIGVQMDGLLVISPHANTTVEIESLIGGDFNRKTGGDLFSQDDFGGFTANIHTPKGTGLTPQLSLLTTGLSFEGLSAEDLTTTGAAAPGWKASAGVRPGERLFLSIFPCRPYDWAKSFDYQWALSDYNFSLDYDNPPYVDNWILWNINQRGWAMSFGERYEIRENVPYQPHMDAITAEGDQWSAYFSQWFYYSRDAQEWVNEIRRWRDTYGMGAIYSDGMAQDDWLSAYEAMRRLRGEVFPNGNIIIHDSYPQSAVSAASFRPFIYTYATSTYMGENAVAAAGADWAWARYVMGQYRRANAFGVTKGDAWAGANGVDKYLIALVWGGRGSPDVIDYDNTYMPILNQLESLWQIYGNEEHFFDRYYHPEAQILTGFNIGRAGMPIIALDTLSPSNIQVSLSSWTPNASLHYTLDGSVPTLSSEEYLAPILWDGEQQIRIRAFRADLDDSRIAELGTEVQNPLPVTLLNFKAHVVEEEEVLLEWTTSSEQNNQGFDIQRSADGLNWTTLGFQAGAGFSTNSRQYQFVDKNTIKGLAYYRLKQIDWDEQYEFSNIVSVDLSQQAALQFYPNPTRDNVLIRGTVAGWQLEVMDGFGKTLQQGFTSSTITKVVLEGYPAGIYLVRLIDPAGRQRIEKIFKQ
ncbi:MAG: chitobiase/beta-hexosaminidase C-terminal domain-containing protein [Bacteroidota bacterium]